MITNVSWIVGCSFEWEGLIILKGKEYEGIDDERVSHNVFLKEDGEN
jgi:hypothetical protein